MTAQDNAHAAPEDARAARKRRENIPLGIVFMIGATLTFAATNGLSKWLVAIYPVHEVLFVRTLFSLAACALVVLPVTGIAVFRTRRLGEHARRGFSQFCSQTCILIALKLMPIAAVIAISFSAPLFATLFSAWLLKETVGPHRWAALLVGLLGVLVVTSPGAEAFQIGSLFALGNAILYASVTVSVRGMTATETPQTLMMYQLVFLTAFFGLAAPIGFVLPSAFDFGILALTGLVNALGQYWWTKALQLAPAPAVTPFYYLLLVWTAAIGFLFWGDVPSTALLIGSAIVVASGLFLLWREIR